jgi:integron integrase
MREVLRLRRYSYHTERSYIEWVERYFAYSAGHDLPVRLPSSLRDYLSYLATGRNVSASTQNQAFSALLMLFREVFQVDLRDLAPAVRAKRGRKLPVVLSVAEVRAVLDQVDGLHRLLLEVLYGTGVRLSELTRLRVKDLDFEHGLVYVRDGKGAKDRTTLFPKSVQARLRVHLEEVQTRHEADLEAGYGEVYLPDALAHKYANAAREWGWQYVFPSVELSVDPRGGKVRRHHISPGMVQAAVHRAVRAAGIVKPASVHTMRHYTECRIMPTTAAIA